MDSRIKTFLDMTLQGYSSVLAIPGDASKRRYYRVLGEHGKSFILMDTIQEISSFQPYLEVTQYLKEIAIRVPAIYHHNADLGLILMENLGEQAMKKMPGDPDKAYKKAVDILLNLHKSKPMSTNTKKQDKAKFMQGIETYVTWYSNANDLQNIEKRMSDLYDSMPSLPEVTVLGDYHAENIFYIQAEDALGLIDFQDAMLGSPMYDLVSLLEDARTEVSSALQSKYLNYYINNSDIASAEDLKIVYQIWGLQRNFRILGTFSRLGIRDNKTSYLQYIPRILGYLKLNPYFAEIA